MATVSANSRSFLLVLFFCLPIAPDSEALLLAVGHRNHWRSGETHHVKGRVLLSFKEKPAGSNITFECSPSGLCVNCLYSEKGDSKYRCSETGYHIPFKCIEIKVSMKDSKRTNSQNARLSLEISDKMDKLNNALHDAREFTTSVKHRSLVDDSFASDNKSRAYITYRSCILPATEEKLSVLRFEVSILLESKP
ncbi:uncharacterized protein LOC129311114 isoform X2 [Prosopis cineraria]|uniref:uncharacterized protein LOC129295186 isoform X2 n=1 Tax=Prosopis cineraria TaxID=364024 RepID=UPI00240F6E0C|nr:uncharacterized protein LOC129295186 isoform X2 [Prosopis cineraria]XP_054809107.1 uncharacterized protein LOC129311114 isoform X2 [Prosopis cineraria]